MSNVNVEYVGKKDQRADTVAGTGLIWYGAGDVKPVPVEAALKLSRHPDVWRVLQEGPISTADVDKALGLKKSLDHIPVDAPGMLLGTDKLPDLVDITATEQATRDDISRAAFKASDMTEQEWNGLEPEIRDELILGHLEQIRADFAKKPAAKTAPAKTAPAKKAPAKKTAAKK